MLKLHHILGKTYAIETQSTFVPVYQLNEREVVLLDSGFASDRASLIALLRERDWGVRGIICSHAHMDHSGNIRFLQERYDCLVAAHEIEAEIAATPESFRSHYCVSTPDENGGLEECFATTDRIAPQTRQLEFCGAEFQILQLPGHSAGHIGIITPDNVAYVGDALMGMAQLAASKMPTTGHLHRDLASKRSLHDVRATAYIIPHKNIMTDIHSLIDANIRCYEEKAYDILAALRGAMTLDEWLRAYCDEQQVSVRSEDGLFVLRYGFRSMVDYLEELGEVYQVRDGDIAAYVRMDQM